MKWDEYILLRDDYVPIGYGTTPRKAIDYALNDDVPVSTILKGCVYKAYIKPLAVTVEWDHQMEVPVYTQGNSVTAQLDVYNGSG